MKFIFALISPYQTMGIFWSGSYDEEEKVGKLAARRSRSSTRARVGVAARSVLLANSSISDRTCAVLGVS